MSYTVKRDGSPHTCWDDGEWDGTLWDGCPGCNEARQYPCEFCGYGHVFTTHNPEAHEDYGDPDIPDLSGDANDEWWMFPHIYGEDE